MIDADALIMALRLEYPMMPMFKETQKEWEIKTDGYRKAEEVIKEAPSIDIVFCKECKYEKRCTTNVHFIADNGLDVIPVHFCSYGEREGE